MDEAIKAVRKESNMYWTISVILLMLWLLGLVTGYSMGGVIYILPVIAVIIALIRVIQGRRLAKDFAASWTR